MNETSLKAQWDQFMGEAKSTWGKLTNDELKQIGGEKDKLLAKLKEHYGYGKEKAQKEFDKFLSGLGKDGHHYGQAVSDGIRILGDKAQSLSHDLADKSEVYLAKGGELNDQARQKFNESCDNILEYAKAHPVKSALIAAGVGLVIGKLLK